MIEGLVEATGKWRLVLITVCLLTMSVAAVFPLANSYISELLNVKIRFIDIEGILKDEKIDAINERLADLDLEVLSIVDIKQSLEDLDWVDRVTIRKKWPDRMHIDITEEAPLARWNDVMFLNSDAEVFSSDFLAEIEIPFLHGPTGTERLVMWQFQKLNSVVGVTGQSISSLSLNDRGGWSFILGNISITLGKEDILERMRRFLRVYREIESAKQLADITGFDTRYPNGVAVNWKNGRCQAECYAENNSSKRDLTL